MTGVKNIFCYGSPQQNFSLSHLTNFQTLWKCTRAAKYNSTDFARKSGVKPYFCKPAAGEDKLPRAPNCPPNTPEAQAPCAACSSITPST